MPNVEIEVRISIQTQNPFGFSCRHSLPARLTSTSIQQTLKPVVLELPLPTTHRSVTDSEDLGGLPPRNLLRHGSQYHFVHFHCSLPLPSRYLLHALLRHG